MDTENDGLMDMEDISPRSQEEINGFYKKLKTQHWWRDDESLFFKKKKKKIKLTLYERKISLLYEVTRRHPDVVNAWKERIPFCELGWHPFPSWVTLTIETSWNRLSQEDKNLYLDPNISASAFLSLYNTNKPEDDERDYLKNFTGYLLDHSFYDNIKQTRTLFIQKEILKCKTVEDAAHKISELLEKHPSSGDQFHKHLTHLKNKNLHIFALNVKNKTIINWGLDMIRKAAKKLLPKQKHISNKFSALRRINALEYFDDSQDPSHIEKYFPPLSL